MFDLISDWRKSDWAFLQRAHGELIGLGATVKVKDNWARARDEIIVSGTGDMKIGLAHAMVNMWSNERLRQGAGRTLVALLSGAGKDLLPQ